MKEICFVAACETGENESFSSLIGKVVICLVDFKLPLILYHLQVKMSSFLADEWWSANWGCHQEIRNVSRLYIFNMLHQNSFQMLLWRNVPTFILSVLFLNKQLALFLKYLLFTNCDTTLASYMMHVWRSGRDWWKITISTQEKSLHVGTRRDWDTKHSLVSVVTLHPPVSPTAAWYILTASVRADPAQHSCFVATAW